MAFKITPGSERARCQICNKIIEKDSCDVEYFTYKHNTHHHGECVKKINKEMGESERNCNWVIGG